MKAVMNEKKIHHPLFCRDPTTTSMEESDTNTTTADYRLKKVSSLALQLVNSEDLASAPEPMTIAEEMASFEYIDELAHSITTSSSFSDFDVWSPKDPEAGQKTGNPLSPEDLTENSSKKDRFLAQIPTKRARRASAESLSSNLISPKTETLATSFSVTTELNRIQDSASSKPAANQSSSNKNSDILPQKTATNPLPSSRTRQRNVGTRQSKLVRQSKVDDHR